MDFIRAARKLFFFLYSDLVFLARQNGHDLLPMRHKFVFSDIILFYRITRNEVKIELPYYISEHESQDVKYVTRSSQPIKNGLVAI